jgi:ATP:ADP antiporter, AAA family
MELGRSDSRALTRSVLVAGLIMAQHVSSKALRDGLFLSHFPASDLPLAMVAAALIALPAVLVVSSGMLRFGPGRVACAALAASALLFAAEWLLIERSPKLVAAALYLHVATLGGIVISAFWSVINERFDPHTAKRYVGRIASGAAVGGVVGGLLLASAASLAPRSLLLALGLSSAFSAIGVLGIGAAVGTIHTVQPKTSAVTALRGSGYLRTIASLVILNGLLSALLDYVFKAGAVQRMPSGPALTSFFAIFYTVTSVLTVLVQTGAARRALNQLGLAGTLALLPAAVLLTGTLSASVARLWSITLMRGTASVLEGSMFRSAYEPLYTPVPANEKRASKTLIDVAASRLGDALGSGLVLAVLWSLPQASVAPMIGLGMLAAALSLGVTVQLHHGYVAALVASLRSGALALTPSQAEDRTTRLAITQTQIEVDRLQLLAQLDVFRAAQLEQHNLVIQNNSPLLARAEDLLSTDPTRVIRALAEVPLDRRFVAWVIPMLAREELSAAAISALRTVAAGATGQLIDTLLDGAAPSAVRRRLARVLKVCEDPRAVRGLVAALGDPELEVRRQVVLSLLDLTQGKPALKPPARLVFEAARRELAVPFAVVDAQHVFALLGLALDREPLALAQRAFAGGDAHQRGTALEYLESVLPEPLRSELWPHVRVAPTRS